MIVHPAIGQVLPLERHILNDQLFIWLHFGKMPVAMANDTGQVLGKIFDSSDVKWGGPGVIAAGGPGAVLAVDLGPGELIDIAPCSVVVFEKKY